jgi:hypothetical protein
MDDEKKLYIAPQTLEAFAATVMRAVGMSDADAQTVA